MTGLQKLVIEYFERNPDEELTIDDAATKWGKSRGWAEEVLRDLELMGYIGARYVQSGSVRTKIYRAAYIAPRLTRV